MHTFYLSPEQWGEVMKLSGQEAHHLGRVLRLHPGDEIFVLNGQGREARCRITQVDRQAATLHILEENGIHVLLEASYWLSGGVKKHDEDGYWKNPLNLRLMDFGSGRPNAASFLFLPAVRKRGYPPSWPELSNAAILGCLNCVLCLEE